MKNKANVGDKVGRLFVKEIFDKDFATYRKKVAICECECGAETRPMLADIRSGKTLSCGCYSREVASKSNKTHGFSDHPLYSVWLGMVRRCYDPDCKSYPNYGGRGIDVCIEWKDNPEQFIKDMSTEYQKGLDLDRIDNNQGYYPTNCRWASRQENLRNKRPPTDTSSKYKGVSFHKTKNKWTAFILDSEGKQVWLGRHSTEKEAAFVSYKAHKEYYGYWPPYCEEHLGELGLLED